MGVFSSTPIDNTSVDHSSASEWDVQPPVNPDPVVAVSAEVQSEVRPVEATVASLNAAVASSIDDPPAVDKPAVETAECSSQGEEHDWGSSITNSDESLRYSSDEEESFDLQTVLAELGTVREGNSRALYSGKTMRRRSDKVRTIYRRESDVTISARYPSHDIDGETKVVYRTALEQDTDIDDYSKVKDGEFLEATLSKSDMWDKVLQVLTKNAVKVHRAHDRSRKYYNYDKDTFVFELPVTNEKTVRKAPTFRWLQRRSEDYFEWQGRTYRIDVIYHMSGDEKPVFTEIGQYNYVEIPDNHTEKVVQSIKHKHQIDAGCYHVSKLVPSSRPFQIRFNEAFKEKFEGRCKPIQFDFGEDTTVTHISTMGLAYDVNSYYGKKKARTPQGCSILYTVESGKHFVTKYKVMYRRHKAKEWVDAGTYTGNSDRLTEVSQKLSDEICARYIRILPLEYKDSPSMRVRFFGPDDGKDAGVDKSEEYETVEYRVEITEEKRGVFQYENYYKFDDWMLDDRKFSSNNRMKRRESMLKFAKKRNLGVDDELADY